MLPGIDYALSRIHTYISKLVKRLTSTQMPSSSLIKPSKRDIDETKWFEHAVNGGTLILEGIRQAAQFAPVPFLQQAADAALTIVKIVQVCCSHDDLISALYV